TRNRPRLMPVLAARSCPFKCTFCYVTGGKTYRIRSVPSLMQEIQYFHDRYRFNILKLYDDLFSVNKPRVREFCQELRKLNLDIHWSCTIRVADVDLDLLRDMKEAGCIHIQYGFESAHQDVLESMVKKTTVEQIRKAIEWSEEVGIGVQGNFIFGDPAETPESIEQTRDFFEKYCKDHIIHCDYITPYPGSPLFLQHCQKHGLIPDKKKYYENLHLRPRFNMTPMSYKEFRDRVEPIVRNKWIGYQPASEVSF
ncbi:MAG: radical SAM protein, partial [Nitrospinaceae bacterium]|nr:radical SAM protein [Nitrospinaceae bacterium]NIR55490.1 radical SAM protein [Nitrospinaceae bacterium]NIS85660.1 radical SAM protein [Nitrospinaceae bacterium]NIT82505.1 radical SAM protein [Nitrospinaceae bacterium]NIU44710.1 radical SAM protein [Nitrospinaceae bacterium]